MEPHLAIEPLPSERSVLFCTSFEADVRIQLPIMQAFRARGDRIAVLSLELDYGYDPGRRVLEAAGIDYIKVTAEEIPPASGWLDNAGPHFPNSRILHQTGTPQVLDPELVALIDERVAIFSAGKRAYREKNAEKMDWVKLCGFRPDLLFMCSSLVRFKLVMEMARRDGVPIYNYWHGFMHPAVFATPFEYWWVDHPVAWGENQREGYEGCGCPPGKLILQAPGQFIGRTAPIRRTLFDNGLPTLLVNSQGIQPKKATWPFRTADDLERWIAGIADALTGIAANVVVKEHPVNGRRMEEACRRLFAGREFRFIFDEVPIETLAYEVDAAVMLASTTAIDLMMAGVPLICFEPDESELPGWNWSLELTRHNAAQFATTTQDLAAAIRRSLRPLSFREPSPALAPFLANATDDGFSRFIETARQGSISAILKRGVEPLQTQTPRVLWLNDTSQLDHFGCVLTSRGLRAALTARFPRAAINAIPLDFTRRFPGPNSLDAMEALLLSDDAPVVELKRAIAGSDFVMINGEGTFFGQRKETFALLFFAYAAARMGKLCLMLNNSFATTGMTADEIALCRQVLSGIHDFQVREPHSFAKLRDAGFPCRLSADALYLGLAEAAAGLTGTPAQPRIFLSGSVLFTADPPEVEKAVGAQLDLLARHFPPKDYEYVALVRGRVEREVFTRQGAKVGARLVEFSDLGTDAFVALLAGSSFAVTGRFHYNMAAGALGVPFVPLDSNNEKMLGLCRELGLDLTPIPYQSSKIDLFRANLDNVANSSETLSHDLRRRAADLAARVGRTFDRL